MNEDIKDIAKKARQHWDEIKKNFSTSRFYRGRDGQIKKGYLCLSCKQMRPKKYCPNCLGKHEALRIQGKSRLNREHLLEIE